MLKAVTFDFWNTLFTDVNGRERERRRADVLIEELKRYGRSPAPAVPVIEEALRTGFGFFDQVWLDEHRTPLCPEIVDSVLAALDQRLPAPSYSRVVEQFEEMILELPPEPTRGAGDVLGILAVRYRLALICDTGYSPGSVLRRLMEHHNLLGYFDYLYFSNEHGMSKPDARVFKRTLGQLGVKPREAAHVGDIQRTDIAGAQAAGMMAVHFVGANDRDAAHSTAEALVREFDELPATLDKLPRARFRLASPLSRRFGHRRRA